MSSATTSDAVVSTVTLSTATTTTSSDSNVMAQRGSNYFFGFLITFIILFLIFVGCGIASRRRLLRARGDTLATDPWGVAWPVVEQKRPTFYEYSLGAATKVDQWEHVMVRPKQRLKPSNIELIPSRSIFLSGFWYSSNSLNVVVQPLSSALLRSSFKTALEDPDDGPRSISPNPEASTGSNTMPYHIFPGLALQRWIARQKNPPELDKEPYDPPEALNISVMIAMPCSPRDRRRTLGYTDFVRLTERQFGTSIVPWHTEVPSTLVPVVLASRATTPSSNS
jgi:hypothetical protein